LFWAKGNNPSTIERTHADMWEHDVIKLYKGLFHVNPGGFTYTEGWSELMKDYTLIMNENTVLREAHANNKTLSKLVSENGETHYLPAILLIGLGIGIFWYRHKK
jgi:hydroxylamine dehydrogenase